MVYAKALACMLAAAFAAAACGQRFVLLLPPGAITSYTWGISPSGNIAMGQYTTHTSGPMAFRWDPTRGFVSFNQFTELDCASANDSIVAGSSGHKVFRLGPNGLENFASSPNYIYPVAMSSDGSIITGQEGGRAFVWKEQTGLEFLPNVSGSFYYEPTISGMSADGRTIVGWSGYGSSRAYTWVDGKPALFLAGDSRFNTSKARGISPDGTVIVGTAGYSGAFVWSRAGGVRWIVGERSQATAVSNNGGVVVGGGDAYYLDWYNYAWAWSEQAGAVNLNELFGRYLPNGLRLYFAWGVSADGSKIIGQTAGGLYGWSWYLDTDTRPETFSMSQGLVNAGALDELQERDGRYLVLRPRHGRHVISVEIDGTAPVYKVPTLSFTLVSGSTPADAVQKIELYNFAEGRWEEMNVRTIGAGDTSVKVPSGQNAWRFVNSASRLIRARISLDAHHAFGQWRVRIDRAHWSVVQ